MKNKRTAVEEAAYRWWLNNRPAGWDEKQHLKEKRVNCKTGFDRWLAEAVAAMIEAEQYVDYRT